MNRDDWFVDDLYDMTEQQLEAEARKYANLARFGPTHPKPAYVFAYYRHAEATKLLEAIRKK